MNVITLDFETYFDDEYSLKKMTTEAYVRDPRFKALGLAWRCPTGQIEWWDADRIWQRFADMEWDKTAVLAHHAHFDGLILSHHYGIKPKLWLDTLSMARLMLGNHVRVGLEALAAHFNMSPKSVPYNLFRGKHWEELSSDAQNQLATGAEHDVQLTWDIFQKLLPAFPREELYVIDQTIRMFTEPTLIGDVELLGKVWTDEAKRKRDLLADLGVQPSDLQSSAKFAQLLEAEGVEIPRKEGKNGEIYPFAKTDEFMKELQNADDYRVASLAQARLGIKSSITQTRAERLGYMAQRGRMCVYLSYCGAHTTRWSGGDKVNWQNLIKGTPQRSDLANTRRSIQAPPGALLVKADASQIQCRLLNFLAGQQDKIDEFRQGKDPYIKTASEYYGYPVNKDDHPLERQLGKVVELQSGFQCGGESIRRTLRNKAGIIISSEEGMKARDAYRATHPNVVDYWAQAEQVLFQMGHGQTLDWGPMIIKDKRVYLPNGMPLIYDTLEYDTDLRSWMIRTRSTGRSKIYGGKFVENIVQAFERLHMSQAILRVKKETGFNICMNEHDSSAWCVPIDIAHNIRDIVICELKREPPWLPGIPLDAEGFIGDRYEK